MILIWRYVYIFRLIGNGKKMVRAIIRWIFGNKRHLTCTIAIGDLVLPLTADVTTANAPDNNMYVPLTSSSSIFSLPSVFYTIADPGYDARKL
jgi:hypothetical protein